MWRNAAMGRAQTGSRLAARGDGLEQPPHLDDLAQRVIMQQLDGEAEPLQEQARIQTGHVGSVASAGVEHASDDQRFYGLA